ncbi:MAG: argininosuccinate lyase [halophilic archaeon J07HX5]|jgi:argininosuccinate lyase (EC 4.3.2.1)|nr:MAG: argininosuccinate lyase [halophilic archaeon J07HX5]
MTDEPAVRRDRFTGGPARSFLSSLAADSRIFAADIAVDQAHVVMLAEQEIVADETAGLILEALAAVETAGHAELPSGEDVHEAIETAVIDRIGSDGGRMHTARSRNDEVAACLRYRLRADLLGLLDRLCDARSRLQAVAAAESMTPMPGYTHLQPAQPTTVAHWALSYEAALARDTSRLRDAYDRLNRSPLGAAAFAGTPFPIDRERTADLLGFTGVVENATDAVSTRDFLLEVAGALATTAVTVSGLAADVIEFVSRGLMTVDDDYASTSSIMPQKKNPDTLELARARAGDASAALSALVTTLTGLPRAYNRDLQRVTTHFWEAVDETGPAVAAAVGAVATAEWPSDQLAAAATEGFAAATGVADRLAMAGVPFRTAHELVAEVAAAAAGTPSLEAVQAAVSELAVELDDETLATVLTAEGSVAMRDSRGGPAPAAVAAQRDRAETTLADHRDATDDRRQRVDAAATRLATAVDRYV